MRERECAGGGADSYYLYANKNFRQSKIKLSLELCYFEIQTKEFISAKLIIFFLEIRKNSSTKRTLVHLSNIRQLLHQLDDLISLS